MAPRLPTGSLSLCLRRLQLNPPLVVPRTAKRGVKSGWSTAPPRNKHRRFNQPTAGLPRLTMGPAAALKRKEHTTPLRTGVLAIKKGMTGFYTRKGTRFACTVLQLDRV